MSYTINLTNGNVFATIPDGTINSTSSMTLIGKNYAGYGQFLDDNFIHLLESGANGTAPTAPLTGQLYYNTTASTLQVYKGSTIGWKTIAGMTAASTAPTTGVSVAGDLWYDSGNVQLNVYSGNSWITVGPAYNPSQGTTGAVPAIITDGSGGNHVVTELYCANVIVGIVSKDTTFTPQTAISGFATIAPGIQLTTAGNTAVFTSTAVSTNNILNSGTAGTGNIGNVSVPFNTIFATATTAQYADLAERFATDVEYEAGTVVELGGSAEITKVTAELSDSVFGVISTRAAYLMNGGAGTDATHPPVAMTGRVPVKVVGQVLKGDRLVSAGNGIARAAQPGEASAFNVIGRALVSKLDTGLGTVEAIVTIK